eukprot:jgi/Mesvir1/5633/Mv15651-RA.1
MAATALFGISNDAFVNNVVTGLQRYDPWVQERKMPYYEVYNPRSAMTNAEYFRSVPRKSTWTKGLVRAAGGLTAEALQEAWRNLRKVVPRIGGGSGNADDGLVPRGVDPAEVRKAKEETEARNNAVLLLDEIRKLLQTSKDTEPIEERKQTFLSHLNSMENRYGDEATKKFTSTMANIMEDLDYVHSMRDELQNNTNLKRNIEQDLENTRKDLEETLQRMQIMGESHGNMEAAAERIAKDAKVQELQQKIRSKEDAVRLLEGKNKELYQTITRTTRDIGTLKRELASSQDAVTKSNATLREERNRAERLNTDLRIARQAKDRLTKELSTANAQVQSLQTQTRQMESDLRSTNATIQSYLVQINGYQEQVQKISDDMFDLVRAGISNEEENAQFQALQTKLEQAETELEEKREMLFDAKKIQSDQARKISEARNRLEQEVRSVSDLMTLNMTLSDEIESQKERYKELQSQHSNELSQREENYKALLSEREKLATQYAIASRKLQEVKAAEAQAREEKKEMEEHVRPSHGDAPRMSPEEREKWERKIAEKDASIVSLQTQIKDAGERATAALRESEKIAEELALAHKEIAEEKAKSEAMETRLRESQASIAELQRQMDGLTKGRDQAAAEAKVARTNHDTAKALAEVLQGQLKDLTEEFDNLQFKKGELEDQLENAPTDQSVKDLQARLEQNEKDLAAEKENIKNVYERLQNATNEIGDWKEKALMSEKVTQELTEKLVGVTEAHEDMTRKYESEKTLAKDLREQVSQLEEARNRIAAEVESRLKEEKEKAAQDRSGLEAQLKNVTAKLDETTARNHDLRKNALTDVQKRLDDDAIIINMLQSAAHNASKAELRALAENEDRLQKTLEALRKASDNPDIHKGNNAAIAILSAIRDLDNARKAVRANIEYKEQTKKKKETEAENNRAAIIEAYRKGYKLAADKEKIALDTLMQTIPAPIHTKNVLGFGGKTDYDAPIDRVQEELTKWQADQRRKLEELQSIAQTQHSAFSNDSLLSISQGEIDRHEDLIHKIEEILQEIREARGKVTGSETVYSDVMHGLRKLSQHLDLPPATRTVFSEIPVKPPPKLPVYTDGRS